VYWGFLHGKKQPDHNGKGRCLGAWSRPRSPCRSRYKIALWHRLSRSLIRTSVPSNRRLIVQQSSSGRPESRFDPPSAAFVASNEAIELLNLECSAPYWVFQATLASNVPSIHHASSPLPLTTGGAFFTSVPLCAAFTRRRSAVRTHRTPHPLGNPPKSFVHIIPIARRLESYSATGRIRSGVRRSGLSIPFLRGLQIMVVRVHHHDLLLRRHAKQRAGAPIGFGSGLYARQFPDRIRSPRSQAPEKNFPWCQ